MVGTRAHGIVQFVGPNHALQIFGIRLFGVNATTGKKLLFTVAFNVMMLLAARLFDALAGLVGARENDRLRFWWRQGIRLVMAAHLPDRPHLDPAG